MFFSHRGRQWFSLLSELLLHVLLGLCLHDVEASGGKQVIHKKVGDSVEISSNLPTEGVSRARWKYEDSTVADQRLGVIENNPFQARVQFNNVNFSLTIKDLTLQDSGDFSFISLANDQQRPTVFITLLVHEPISKKPDLNSTISEPDSKGVCTVHLECRAASHSNISYTWIVGKQTYEGQRLEHNITLQDGNTTFTCTASNVVSEMSALETVMCRNNTKPVSDEGSSSVIFWVRLAIAVLVILFLVSLLHFTNTKDLLCTRVEGTATADQDQTQQHPLSSPPPGDESVYEKMRGSIDAEQGEPSDENL
ncbi:uncharacterized protein LOC105917664 [Fundulus heteroclitus]|uniref:uncharacterized protein LOC105917664 n=1 Tax=Fundulus heteroclitus TaxID=8078 RepID=UPI00165CDB7E|nr:uncharacterized protein LOC105917664 [Fundulus heteroclitus]